jgi:ERF superfamily
MKTQEIERISTPHDLIAAGIEKGLDTQSLKELMDLKERYDKGLARKAFFQAFTEFQAHCPDLRKTKAVEFGNTKYNYAPLADISRQIGKVLKDNQLSYRWEIKDDGEVMNVSCLVSHVDGHTETTTMSAKADTSGSKNPIQARGSAIEYLKRYTLIGALGISTADSDIDARLPDVDIDKLHRGYMEVYNQIIQIDSSLTKYNPDNWKVEATPKLYVKATGEIRKVLFDLQQKHGK